MELNLQEQDLRLAIGDVLALARDELTMRRVALEARISREPLMANVDADLLKQAALNVIQNGAQAMPDGGRLEVVLEEERGSATGAPSARGNSMERARAAPRFAVLRIADEGPGISEEIREKIFDLYFTTKSGGSGIGLAMTYRILQLHHGSVEVQSIEGHGAEFRLRIPLTAEKVRRAIEPASVESGTEFGR